MPLVKITLKLWMFLDGSSYMLTGFSQSNYTLFPLSQFYRVKGIYQTCIHMLENKHIICNFSNLEFLRWNEHSLYTCSFHLQNSCSDFTYACSLTWNFLDGTSIPFSGPMIKAWNRHSNFWTSHSWIEWLKTFLNGLEKWACSLKFCSYGMSAPYIKRAFHELYIHMKYVFHELYRQLKWQFIHGIGNSCIQEKIWKECPWILHNFSMFKRTYQASNLHYFEIFCNTINYISFIKKLFELFIWI